MAQLRCAQTSELLLEGTPLEVATAADGFPAGEVLFDDVGPDFNAKAVRDRYAGELDGLNAALAGMPSSAPTGASDEERAAFKAQRDSLNATLAERQERIDVGRRAVPVAKRLRDAALERVAQRQAEDAARLRRRR